MGQLPESIEQEVFSEMTLWLVKNRPSEDIRPKLDINWRLENQSLFIYEIRPHFKDPTHIMHLDFVKATYVKARNTWKVYWKRADLKWHAYEPLLYVNNIKRFLQEVDQDPLGCFKG